MEFNVMLRGVRFVLVAVMAMMLVACGGPPFSDTLPGSWTVQGPDRGESLQTPEDRILVAGSYEFATGGHVKIALRLRDKDSKEYAEVREGSWRMLDPKQVEVTVTGSHVEVFEQSGAREMLRKSTTIARRTWEKQVFLRKQ